MVEERGFRTNCWVISVIKKPAYNMAPSVSYNMRQNPTLMIKAPPYHRTLPEPFQRPFKETLFQSIEHLSLIRILRGSGDLVSRVISKMMEGLYYRFGECR